MAKTGHDDVIKWKHFPRYWPFVRGIHRFPVNSPHKGQWRGAFTFPLICTLNKRLSKQSAGWWFETLSHPLWRHCNVLGLSKYVYIYIYIYIYIVHMRFRIANNSTYMYFGSFCTTMVWHWIKSGGSSSPPHSVHMFYIWYAMILHRTTFSGNPTTDEWTSGRS